MKRTRPDIAAAVMVKAARCEACGHPMSARSDDALADAIGEHMQCVPGCRLVLAVRVAALEAM
jgi:hypothetical protein